MPDGWDDSPLSSLCSLVNGRGFKPHEWGRVGYPIIRIQNLNGSDDFNYFAGRFDPKLLVEDGQLLFAWSGSRGSSFGPHIWRGQTAVLNYHTWKVVTFDKKIDVQFFFHALRQLTKSIEDAAHGASALVHTQKREMESLLVRAPRALSEQCAIAAALSDADALIASLDALIAKKRDLKQAVAQQLLTGKTRLPGFKGEWQEVVLGEKTTKVGSGITPTGGARVYKPFGRPFLRSQNIGWGVLLLDDIAYIDDELHETFNSTELVAGDVLLNITGASIGRSAVADVRVQGGNVNQHVCIVRTICEELLSDFLNLFLLSEVGQRQIDSFQAGGNRQGLNFQQIRSIKLSVPPTIEEQRRIAIVLKDFDAEAAELKKWRDKYHALKQGMMQELLTGRIRLI